MAIQRNRCYSCGRGVAFGNNVSHANNKTRRVLLFACETLFPNATPRPHE